MVIVTMKGRTEGRGGGMESCRVGRNERRKEGNGEGRGKEEFFRGKGKVIHKSVSAWNQKTFLLCNLQKYHMGGLKIIHYRCNNVVKSRAFLYICIRSHRFSLGYTTVVLSVEFSFERVFLLVSRFFLAISFLSQSRSADNKWTIVASV